MDVIVRRQTDKKLKFVKKHLKGAFFMGEPNQL